MAGMTGRAPAASRTTKSAMCGETGVTGMSTRLLVIVWAKARGVMVMNRFYRSTSVRRVAVRSPAAMRPLIRPRVNLRGASRPLARRLRSRALLLPLALAVNRPHLASQRHAGWLAWPMSTCRYQLTAGRPSALDSPSRNLSSWAWKASRVSRGGPHDTVRLLHVDHEHPPGHSHTNTTQMISCLGVSAYATGCCSRDKAVLCVLWPW